MLRMVVNTQTTLLNHELRQYLSNHHYFHFRKTQALHMRHDHYNLLDRNDEYHYLEYQSSYN